MSEEREYEVTWSIIVPGDNYREAAEEAYRLFKNEPVGRGFQILDITEDEKLGDRQAYGPVYVDLDDDGGVSICPNCGKQADEDGDGLHYCPRCDLQLDHLTEDCEDCQHKYEPTGRTTGGDQIIECVFCGATDLDPAQPTREYAVGWSYSTHAESPEAAASLAHYVVSEARFPDDRQWSVTDVESGENFDVELPPAAPAAGRPTVIDHAECFDSEGTLALQVEGYDAIYVKQLRYNEDGNAMNGQRILNAEQYQAVIDVICEALGVADEQPICPLCGEPITKIADRLYQSKKLDSRIVHKACAEKEGK